MRIPISLAILGTVALIGAIGAGVWKLRDLRPAPTPQISIQDTEIPNQETAIPTQETALPRQGIAIAQAMIGQWRPAGLTCADGVTITFHSGALTVKRGSEAEVQAVAGLEPNGFIRTYSANRGSRFYVVQGDTLIMRSADGQTAELRRCDATAPLVTTAAASAHNAAPSPPSRQASSDRTGAEAAHSLAPQAPARATATVSAGVAPEAAPSPALTLVSAPTPEPVSAPPPPPITQPVWLARPTAAEVAMFYPEPALVRELPGSARLDCTVRGDGSLSCSVQAESPAGYGFGQAALGIAQSFRMAQHLADGSATEGRHVLVPVHFTQN